MKKFFILIIVIPFLSFSHSDQYLLQSKDPNVILENIRKKFEQVKDYEVDVDIKIDVSFLKVPETHAKIFYKQPDKIHIESKGFALLPKGALDFSPAGFLKGNYTALFDHEEIYEGMKTVVIKTIPLGESGDVVLSTFWIDPLKNIIRKIEVSTKVNGTFTIGLKYDPNAKYTQLPGSLVFTFNITKLNIPKRFTNQGDSEHTKSDSTKSSMGKVYINYSNYKVNQGLPDSLFLKKEN